MQDKSAGARQVAQECLSVLVGAGTVQPSRVRAGTRDFAPAVMRQLKPALEKILDASGTTTMTYFVLLTVSTDPQRLSTLVRLRDRT